jgi:hypothetical protein
VYYTVHGPNVSAPNSSAIKRIGGQCIGDKTYHQTKSIGRQDVLGQTVSADITYRRTKGIGRQKVSGDIMYHPEVHQRGQNGSADKIDIKSTSAEIVYFNGI